jgi:diguanylate cyclase (GGDEF)-like protein/putative nucleotidyltransferase with HDIG domain
MDSLDVARSPREDAAATGGMAAEAVLARLLGLARRALGARAVAVTLSGDGEPAVLTSGDAGALDEAGASVLRAPLTVDGADVGVLVAVRTAGAWSPADRASFAEAHDTVQALLVHDRDGDEAGRRHERLRDVALEQAALRHVATVVASATDPDEVYRAVCREVPGLVGVPQAAVSRFHDGRPPELLAVEGIGDEPAGFLCARLWNLGASPAAERYRAGETFALADAAAVDTDDARRYAAYGLRTVIGAPILVGGELWGALTVGSAEPDAIRPDSARRLERFAELIAVAVANAEARRRLAEQATTDPLTGLANHRRFHEELRAEVARADRHGWPLAIALIDIDHFKQVNDTLGHHAGDELLRAVASGLRAAARSGELVARLGGDEFGAILPGTDDRGAEAFGARVRAIVGRNPAVLANDITLSIGVTDRVQAPDADGLVRHADAALYWAKAHGRDAVARYVAEVAGALTARDRADRLARGQALMALRALARALDLRDPATQRHAERVAVLAQRLAARLGWSDADRARLGEAALLHDIGKIAIPDAVLGKAGALTAQEDALVRTHAALGAEIAAHALDAEQVGWIGHHHERWDGTGYPGGLAGEAIPAGARIIAVAGAFDVMTTARHYREPVAEDVALEECLRLAGTQFAPEVVAALRDERR